MLRKQFHKDKTSREYWDVKIGVNAAVSLLFLGNVFAEANASDCSLKRLASVDLIVDKWVLLPVTVSQNHVFMSLTTSSSYNLISEEGVISLGLSKRRLPSAMSIQIGREQAKEYVAVDWIQIGNTRMQNVDFIVDVPSDNHPLRPTGAVVASLGMLMFGKLDLELDLSHKKLGLYSQDHCAGKAVYWSDHASAIPLYRGQAGDFYFVVELNGRKLEAGISTLLEYSSLEEAASRSLFGIDMQSPGIERKATNGGTRAFLKVVTITAQGIAITNADVMLQSTWEGCKLNLNKPATHAVGFDGCLSRYPLLLGRDVLEKLHLYLATGEKVLYVTSADASRAAAPATSSSSTGTQ